jgi:hypothetical protein
MELDPHVISSTIEALSEAEAICYQEVPIPSHSYFSRARALERRFYFRSTTFEAARGFSRAAFEELGGYDSRLTGLEDMDIQARTLSKRLRVGWVASPLYHHEESLTTMEYLRKRWNYSTRSDTLFKQLHPEYWARLTSPLLRGRIVLHNLHECGSWKDMTLVPGLALNRAIEVALRYSGSRRP